MDVTLSNKVLWFNSFRDFILICTFLLSGKVNHNFNYIIFQVKWNSIDGKTFETEDLDQAIHFQSIPISLTFVFSFLNSFIIVHT